MKEMITLRSAWGGPVVSLGATSFQVDIIAHPHLSSVCIIFEDKEDARYFRTLCLYHGILSQWVSPDKVWVSRDYVFFDGSHV